MIGTPPPITGRIPDEIFEFLIRRIPQVIEELELRAPQYNTVQPNVAGDSKDSSEENPDWDPTE